jgi:hypothetical protein
MKIISPTIGVGYFGLGPVLVASLLAFALTDISWSALQRHERYPDPVAGAIIWSNLDKARDMRALLLLIGSAVALSVVISAGCRQTAPLGPQSDVGGAINQLLLFSLVPAGWRLAVACMNPPDHMPPLRFLSWFPLGAVAIVLMLRRYRGEITSANVFTAGAATLLSPVMAAFSALAIPLAIARLIPHSVDRVQPWVSGFATTVIVAVVIVIFVIFAFARTYERFEARLLRLLAGCQYPLPLLLFYLLPPPLVDMTHQMRDPYPRLLAGTLGVIAIITLYRMFRRFHLKTTESNRPLMRAIAPASVACMMIYVLCDTMQLPTISRDYFHTGEQLDAWQQLWDFHKLPYVDFAPIHGLMELLRGTLNQLFFDGSVGTFSEGVVLLAGLAIAVTAVTAAELLSPLGALFFLFAVMPFLDRLYYVAPPLFVIASPRLLGRPVRWLLIWGIMGVFLCGYNAAMGPAFLLGTVPVCLWQIFRAYRAERGRLAGLFAGVIVAVGIAYSIPVVRLVSLGFLKFILDNQWTNEAANGIAWLQGQGLRDRDYGYGSSQFLWEVVRVGWIPVVIGAAVLHWKQWSKAPADRHLPAMVLSASVPPVLLWSCLWVIERIEQGTSGKSGSLTEVALFLITPAMVFLTMPKKHAGLIVLALATFVGFLYPNGLPTGLDPGIMVQKPYSTRCVPAGTEFVDGNAFGMPNMGQVIKPNPDITVDIRNFQKDLSSRLKPGETYLDLGDAGALYYYLGMPSPTQYAAYVAGNARLQGIMMAQLQKNPVPMVVIGPPAWIDGVPVSIRCYQPYRYYALRFVALQEDGFTFLVDPSRVPSAGPVGSELQLQILDGIFRRENILRLPMAWGGSWSSLRRRFDSVARLPAVRDLRAADAQKSPLTWNIPAAATAGAIAGEGPAADFLRFHIDFIPADPEAYITARDLDPVPTTRSAEPQLALSWASADGTPTAPILFKAHNGDLIVPLAAYPRWLLGKHLATISIALANPRCASRMRVSDLEFLRLKPL